MAEIVTIRVENEPTADSLSAPLGASVPGLTGFVAGVREMYPDLSDDSLATILELPKKDDAMKPSTSRPGFAWRREVKAPHIASWPEHDGFHSAFKLSLSASSPFWSHRTASLRARRSAPREYTDVRSKCHATEGSGPCHDLPRWKAARRAA
jgi:hypothetical protein